jgi:hypothetical protein
LHSILPVFQVSVLRPLIACLLIGLVPSGVVAQIGGRSADVSGCGAAIAGNAKENTIEVICGMPWEEVSALVSGFSSLDPARTEAALDLLRARLPEDTALRVDAVAEYFRILGREQVPADQLKDAFAEIAAENIALQDRLRRIESDDVRVQALREQAADALTVDDHDAAKAAIREAREVRRAVLKELAEMAAEEARGLAALTAEEARVELARRDFAAAAALFDAAAAEVAPHDVPAARSYLWDAANAWQTQGDRRGDNAALGTAIARWERVIETVNRETDQDTWAGAIGNLGNALQTLGAREPGTARLEEAVATYRLALEERTRDRVPLDWATTQNNLGAANPQ